MPVNYNLSVSTSRPWTFIKLIFKWEGSVWKAIWLPYAVWLAAYFLLSAYYRWVMDGDQRRSFAKIVEYTDSRLKYFPLSWMLGFFVAAVMARWKYLYNIIGWMDNTALMVAQYVRGTSERARMYRRQIVRHCMVTQALVFRDLSVRCRKRFPTLDTLVAAGIMTQHEFDVFEEIQYRYAKYWIPFQWAWAISYNAWKEGLIEGAYYQQLVSDTIKEFRTGLAWLCNYDWVPLPLIYPTIVCLSVHIYFLVAIVARQFVHESENFDIDLIFPFMTSFEFIFFMGWLKVGEAMLNPWGEDDDDFETNMLIDRNLTMALKIVDEGYGKTPHLAKDNFWDNEWKPMYPEDFDFSRETQKNPRLSMADLRLPSSVSEIRMVPLQQRRGSVAKIVPVKTEDRVHSSTSFHKTQPKSDNSGDLPNGNQSFGNRFRRFSRSLLHREDSQNDQESLKRALSAKERRAPPEVKFDQGFDVQSLPRLDSIILPGITLVEENTRKISHEPNLRPEIDPSLRKDSSGINFETLANETDKSGRSSTSNDRDLLDLSSLKGSSHDLHQAR